MKSVFNCAIVVSLTMWATCGWGGAIQKLNPVEIKNEACAFRFEAIDGETELPREYMRTHENKGKGALAWILDIKRSRDSATVRRRDGASA